MSHFNIDRWVKSTPMCYYIPIKERIPTRHEARLAEKPQSNQNEEKDTGLYLCHIHPAKFGIFLLEQLLDNLLFLYILALGATQKSSAHNRIPVNWLLEKRPFSAK